tara:strand:- start:4056 stop:4838 length:783 start_codon:yes stop_codon:yes gene_type:complete
MKVLKKFLRDLLKFNFVKKNFRKTLMYSTTFHLKNKKRIKSFGNYKLLLDVSEYTAWSYFYKNQEQEEILFIKKIIKNGDNIIDIGANLGFYSLLFASLSPNGKVFSFEPSTKNYKKLLENKELNQKYNILTYKIGISNKKGYQKLFLTSKQNLNEGGNFISSSELKNNLFPEDFEDIKIEILDEIMDKNINFKLAKIDTEGNELNVLNGMKYILKNNLKYLLIETSSNFDLINKFLKEFNFKILKKGKLNSIFEKISIS